MENKKNLFMLLAVVGIITAVVGLVRPIPETALRRELLAQIGDHFHAQETGNGLAPHEYMDLSSKRKLSDNRLQGLTGQSHTIALVGLLLTVCSLTGLWICTNREIENLRNAQPEN